MFLNPCLTRPPNFNHESVETTQRLLSVHQRGTHHLPLLQESLMPSLRCWFAFFGHPTLRAFRVGGNCHGRRWALICSHWSRARPSLSTIYPPPTSHPSSWWERVEVWLCDQNNCSSSLWAVELVRSGGRIVVLGVRKVEWEGAEQTISLVGVVDVVFCLPCPRAHPIRRADERAWVGRGHLCGFIVPFTTVHSRSGRPGGGLVTGTGPLFCHQWVPHNNRLEPCI